MNPIFQAMIGSILRWLLTLGAGWFIARGIWTEQEAAVYVGAIVAALVALLWSQWQKYSQRIKLLTALDMPATKTEVDLAEKIKRGAGATLQDVIASQGPKGDDYDNYES